MAVAVTVVPDVEPVTKMRSPLTIELSGTVVAAVTRVDEDATTFTLVFEAALFTVNVLPLIDVMVPDVPG
jgi:hypothetical protein